MPGDGPTQCPTCGRVMGGSSPIRVHHEQNHRLSLAGIAESEWSEYIAKNADRIENPKGITAKERALAPRHPVYAKSNAYLNTNVSDDAGTGCEHSE